MKPNSNANIRNSTIRTQKALQKKTRQNTLKTKTGGINDRQVISIVISMGGMVLPLLKYNFRTKSNEYEEGARITD